MNQSYDLIVAGSGAAGLAAALVADAQGLKVLIIEKSGLIGGTTSYSGGVSWVPGSRQNVASGVQDSVDRAEEYLDSTIDNISGRAARRHYLETAPEAFATIEQIAGPLFFIRQNNSPDYFPDVPGASKEGRAMTPLSFDGRVLGDRFVDIRGPIPELCLFGRQMLELMDVYHLLNAKRSIRSAMHTAGLMVRDLRDRIFYRKYGRGVRLTGGNALVGRLYKAVLDRGITVECNAALAGLAWSEGRVTGAEIATAQGKRTVGATCGVVLATGGFPWSEQLRNRFVGQVPVGFSATSPDSNGDGIAIALDAGAAMETNNTAGAFWTPVSIATRADGSEARFPHLMADRAKPGLIAIDQNARRFVNEANNYHDFVRVMIDSCSDASQAPFHLVCDSTFLTRYVFGMVPPLAAERRKAIASGYLIKGSTIADLATAMGVDAAAFEQTVRTYNEDARNGIDTQFGKGSTAYNRYLGDPGHKPNPCLAPIEAGPFYAIRIYPGDIGTIFGLTTDHDSRVLNGAGAPIDGLYACGNDRSSIMGGFYPSGGITIGPALTGAYHAARHAAGAASAAAHPAILHN